MKRLLNKLKALFAGWGAPCYKESLGYNCKHRTYANGFKECGNK